MTRSLTAKPISSYNHSMGDFFVLVSHTAQVVGLIFWLLSMVCVVFLAFTLFAQSSYEQEQGEVIAVAIAVLSVFAIFMGTKFVPMVLYLALGMSFLIMILLYVLALLVGTLVESLILSVVVALILRRRFEMNLVSPWSWALRVSVWLASIGFLAFEFVDAWDVILPPGFEMFGGDVNTTVTFTDFEKFRPLGNLVSDYFNNVGSAAIKALIPWSWAALLGAAGLDASHTLVDGVKK